VQAALKAGRERGGKWTSTLEARLLCEYWAQLATRCPRPFAFQGFSEKAVERKLQSMEKVLPESLFKLPLHIPEAELGEVLADCRLLANEHGRAQINADPRGGETWERSTPSPMEEDEPAPSLTLRVDGGGGRTHKLLLLENQHTPPWPYRVQERSEHGGQGNVFRERSEQGVSAVPGILRLLQYERDEGR